MCYTIYLYLLISLVVLLQWWNGSEAKIIVTDRDNVTISFSSHDLLFRPEQPYKYESMVYFHVLLFKEDCRVDLDNIHSLYIQNIILKKLSKYSDFALYAEFIEADSVYHSTEQVIS
jgi:hypothetical protein